MSRLSPRIGRCVVVALSLVASSVPVHGGVIQLVSPGQLGGNTITVPFSSADDLLPSPYTLPTLDNTLSFLLAVGEWRQLDEGVNVLSDFAPGTRLLYTNNNNGVDLNGQGSIGGGGSGPADIVFAEGVRAVGFRAQTQVLGFETLTFSAFSDLSLLGTFSVSRVNGQDENDSASFLGVRATGTDLITRIVLSGVVTQSGVPHVNDFFFGPVSYSPVPEPPIVVLLGLAVMGFIAFGRSSRGTRAGGQT